MKSSLIISSFLLLFGLGCQNAKFGEDVTKHKGPPMVVSKRIIAKEKPKTKVQLREDLEGLNSEKSLDRSLNQRIAQFYEREIPTYKVEPELKKQDTKVFSISPEEDAPLQIFLKPAQ